MQMPIEFIIFIIFFTAFSLGTISYLIYGLTRYNFWGILGSGLFGLGLLFTTFYLVQRYFSSGRAPFSNLFESLLIFAWGIALLMLIFLIPGRLYLLGTIVSPLVTALMLMSLRTDWHVHELPPALQSPWMVYHVSTAIVAYGSFAVSFGFAVMYLIRERLERRSPGSRLLSALPPAGVLDRMICRSIALGFPFLALLIVTGAIWADFAWGAYWRWDPKEVWALITALIYAAYLHGRFTRPWNGRLNAIIAIIGFVSVIICYIGVNLYFSGIHSYGSK